MKRSSDVVFSDAVKKVQTERGSRAAYGRGDFESEVTGDLRDFLAEIDTAYLATASAGGQPYVQHRGGPKGFLRAIDDHTIAFADLSGNRQYVSTGNLSENDRVCLFLMDYARRRRVKVWGNARIVPVTDDLFAKLAPDPRAKVEQVVLLTVTAWDMNCSQHIPQKIDAADVAGALEKLEVRVAELEAENARLRAKT